MKRSPAAALWLSLLPGAGHVYLGQASKGFLLIILVACAIQIVDRGADSFGIMIAFLWLYGMIDALPVRARAQPPRRNGTIASEAGGFLVHAVVGLGPHRSRRGFLDRQFRLARNRLALELLATWAHRARCVHLEAARGSRKRHHERSAAARPRERRGGCGHTDRAR